MATVTVMQVLLLMGGACVVGGRDPRGDHHDHRPVAEDGDK